MYAIYLRIINVDVRTGIFSYPQSFSSNGKPTVVPRDKNILLKDANTLSELDILQTNRAYNCSGIMRN